MDFQIETFLERAWRQQAGCWRAQVVHPDTGAVLYVTWPYRRESSARQRARLWLSEEAKQHRRSNDDGLFGDAK